MQRILVFDHQTSPFYSNMFQNEADLVPLNRHQMPKTSEMAASQNLTTGNESQEEKKFRRKKNI